MNESRAIKVLEERNGKITIKDVQIERETDKQYKLKDSYRNILKKSELSNDIGIDETIIYFCEEDLQDVLVQLKNKREKEIEQSKRRIEKLKTSIGEINAIATK